MAPIRVKCPAAAQTIQWLCQIWGAITGQTPPVTAAVLLAADASVWQPDTAALQQAWHRLRLATWCLLYLAEGEGPQDVSGEVQGIMVSQQYIGVGQHCYRWRGAEVVFDCSFVGHNTGILVLNYLFLTQFSLWCLLVTVLLPFAQAAAASHSHQ